MPQTPVPQESPRAGAVLCPGAPDKGRGDGARVRVRILEGIQESRSWDFARPQAVESYSEPAFGLLHVPLRYTDKGLIADRSDPYMLVASGRLALAQGTYRVWLRSRGAARLLLDGKSIVETSFLSPNSDTHELLPTINRVREPGIHPLPVGHQEKMVTIPLDGQEHDFLLEALVGGDGLRPELGELSVCVAQPDETLQLLGFPLNVPFTVAGWTTYSQGSRTRHRRRDQARRERVASAEADYWTRRHDLARQYLKDRAGPQVPAVAGNFRVHNAVDAFVAQRLEQRGVTAAPLTEDHSFLRRLTLDTVGVVPKPSEIEAFFRDPPTKRRTRVIDRLLQDQRWADHWVGYWQDVLAENPALVHPTLNNTGPFRWWIYESLKLNKPMDRFVTELVMMEGSTYGGGSSRILGRNHERRTHGGQGSDPLQGLPGDRHGLCPLP